jgi:hypothetical protein
MMAATDTDKRYTYDPGCGTIHNPRYANDDPAQHFGGACWVARIEAKERQEAQQ